MWIVVFYFLEFRVGYVICLVFKMWIEVKRFILGRRVAGYFICVVFGGVLDSGCFVFRFWRDCDDVLVRMCFLNLDVEIYFRT